MMDHRKRKQDAVSAIEEQNSRTTAEVNLYQRRKIPEHAADMREIPLNTHTRISQVEFSPKRASLLGIPAELRNQIWRLALLVPESIEMTPQDHPTPCSHCKSERSIFVLFGEHYEDCESSQHHDCPDVEHHDCNNLEPGLLSTCRQIRDETCKIYRQENEIVLHLVDFGHVPQRHHWVWNGSTFLSVPDTPNGGDVVRWSDLEKWFELYYLDLWWAL